MYWVLNCRSIRTVSAELGRSQKLGLVIIKNCLDRISVGNGKAIAKQLSLNVVVYPPTLMCWEVKEAIGHFIPYEINYAFLQLWFSLHDVS